MNFIDIFLTEPVSLHMSVYMRQKVSVWDIDHRHQPALLPSHINCISAAAFHASAAAYLDAASSDTMIISQTTVREKSSDFILVSE